MKRIITHNRFIIGLAVVALAAAGILWKGAGLQPVAASSQNESTGFVSLGITPGQTLRINVSNTAEPLDPGPITWTYTVTNTGSTPLYESGRIQVPPGEFRYSDVSRRDLPVEGEPGTGRVQMLVKLVIQLPRGVAPSDILSSVEIINEETGATTVLSSVRPTVSYTGLE